MTRLLTVAGWAVAILAAAPFLLLALYEVGCAIEALRERRIERRDPQDGDTWTEVRFKWDNRWPQ